jgi:7,8-dihydroneopterin aldolase/epimerase/oxygenase
MDIVFIRELRLQAWVGLHRHEKVAPQTIQLDVEIGLPGDAVFVSGKVGDTIDYGVVVERIRAMTATEHFGLVENLADRIARMIIAEFNAPRARVSITKLGVVKNAKYVGVSIERSRTG